MMRSLAILVLLFSTHLLFGQETATKISDFNYGSRGESIIIGPHAANGTLYGSFWQFYGTDNVGLISVLDPETGAASPVLDPEQTASFAGDPSEAVPNVFAAGGMTFGIQRDLASGNNLYRIENGEATLLLSAPIVAFSEMVEFNDSLYFVVGTLPVSATAGGFDQMIAELWRTDGTPTGTQRVSTLFSFFNEDHTRLVAGEDRLMISLVNDLEQVFYLYDPVAGEVGVLAEGFSQLILDNTRFDRQFNPLAYLNGAFYFFGKDESTQSHIIFQVVENTNEITRLPFPLLNGQTRSYDEGSFIAFQDSLYFQTGSSRELEGSDLYQITSDTETFLRPIYVTDDNEDFGFISDNFQHVIDGDTLYFLSRNISDSITLLAYHQSLSTPIEKFSFPAIADGFFGSPIWTEITDDYIYLGDSGNRMLYRFDRTTQEITSHTVAFVEGGLNSLVSPLVLFNDDLYFVNDLPALFTGTGLYRWENGTESPVEIADYLTIFRRRNPIIRTYDPTANQLLINLDSLVGYDPTEEIFAGISYEDSIQRGTERFIGNFGDVAYFSAGRFGGSIRLIHLDGDSLRFAKVSVIDLPEPSVDYSIRVNGQLNDSIFFGDIQPVRFRERYQVFFTVNDDQVQIRPLLLDLDASSLSAAILHQGAYVSTTFPSNTSDNKWIVLFDDQANEIIRFLIPSGAEVRGVSREGVFVENVRIDFFSIENEVLFYPFANLSQPETLGFDQAVPTPSERDFYVLDNRLLFTGDSPVTGREWYVAVPGSDEVKPLVDANPGSAYGTNITFGYPLGENHLLFVANNGTNGAEPWITDGTSENTRMLADINPGLGSSNPSNIFVRDSVAYFSANGPDGYEVYRMSLRSLQPELIIDLNPGPGDGYPYNFTLIDDDFYFLGHEADGATFELYRIAYDLVPTEAAPTVRPAKLYPNPAGHLPITIEAPSGEQIERVEVFSPSGQLLVEKMVSGPTTQLDLNMLPSGQYWVRAWYASGRFSINGVSRVR